MFKFINTSTTGILTTFGKFSRTLKPGLRFKIPIIQQIHIISNQLKEDTFKFEIKTKDNVFANLMVSVQYKVKFENTEKAFYQMDSPVKQMNSYIENTIRSTTPKMTLDHLFLSQDEIAQDVKHHVEEKMEMLGITIVSTLIKNIEPDQFVKDAMNKINASERLKIAAKEEADAEYIKQVRAAESDKERKRLQGEGISAQRKAIMDGYMDSVKEMSSITGLSGTQIVDFVLTVQRMDMLEIVGKSPNSKTIFVDHSIQKMEEIQQLRTLDTINRS